MVLNVKRPTTTITTSTTVVQGGAKYVVLSVRTNLPNPDALNEELVHLRKECRSQARKLEDMYRAQAARDDEEDDLRRKVGRCSYLQRLRQHPNPGNDQGYQNRFTGWMTTQRW